MNENHRLKSVDHSLQQKLLFSKFVASYEMHDFSTIREFLYIEDSLKLTIIKWSKRKYAIEN